MAEVDLNEVLERYRERGVFEIEEIVGVWEFHIEHCPVDLKIKVVKLAPQGKFMGIANYAIQGPRQATPYKSLYLCDTVQEALEDALKGFLKFWDPKDVNETKFELDKDF